MGASGSVKRDDSDDNEDEEEEEPQSISKSPNKKKKKKHDTHFTPKELQEIKDIEEMQRKATAFISNHFYYGVPVSIVRQSIDPYSPVFVQPDANLAMERVHSHQLDTVRKDWEVMKSVPTTVMVNNKGKVVISFEKTGINYEVSIGNLLENVAKSSQSILDPDPPTLKSRTQTSLTIAWDNLPDPPGLSQYVDVQYSPIVRHKNKLYFKFLDKNQNQEGMYDFDNDTVTVEPWSALVSKTWDQSNFTSFSFNDLSPGSCFIFRLRYRNHRGWSEYSRTSKIYRTEAGVPSPPIPPLSNAIMPHAVHLRWAPPQDNNGSEIVSYVLEGKAVGDAFAVLFSGMRLSFVVFNLFPEAAYNFQVSAVNKIGTSLPSTIYSILTPSQLVTPPYRANWRDETDFMTEFLEGNNGRDNDLSQTCYANAQRCRDAWATHYDHQTNQMFYFNVLTGSRQLHMPNAMINAPLPTPDAEEEIKVLDEVEIANEKKKAFRSKRFRFIRDVHLNRKQRYKDVLSRQSDKGSCISVDSGSPFTLPVIRASLLSDTYKSFSVLRETDGSKKNTASYNQEPSDLLGKLTSKLRIVFHQEAGIDVGGLGKEFYLLLSEQMVAYMTKSCRNLIRLTESGRIFFNEDFCEEDKIFRPKNFDSEHTDDSTASPPIDKKCVSGSSLNELTNLGVRGDDFCQFFGRMLGKAIYDQQMLRMPLCGILLAHLTGHTHAIEILGNSCPKVNKNSASKVSKPNLNDIYFTDDDLSDLDSSLFKSLNWMKTNSIEGVIDSTFSVISRANKSKTEKEINLCKDGDQLEVTDANKFEYLKLLEQWKTTYSVNSLLTKFLEGFWEILPFECIRNNNISKSELDLIINGKTTIDIEEIRAYCVFQGEPEFSDNHPQVIQLWQIVREMEEENKRLFLLFVTGTSRVPLDGYNPPFNITQGVGMERNSLPRAHTCFNQIVIPLYSTMEAMRDKIMFAIKETEGFQLS